MTRPGAIPDLRPESAPGRDAVPLAVAAATAMGGAVVAISLGLADGAEGWRLAARHTARFSFLLFLLAWAAPGLGALGAQGRALGLGFAAAHFVHLGALVTFFAVSGERPDATTLAIGGLGYAVLAGLVALSVPAWRTAAGSARATRLTAWGMNYIALVFLLSYGARAVESPAFAPALALLAAALALRLGARRRRLAA